MLIRRAATTLLWRLNHKFTVGKRPITTILNGYPTPKPDNKDFQQTVSDITSEFLKQKHPDVLINLQMHLLSKLYDSSNISELRTETMKQGDIVIGLQNHPYSLLGSIMLHRNNLENELFIMERASEKDSVIVAKVKQTTSCLSGTLTVSDAEGPVNFLLIDPKQLTTLYRHTNFERLNTTLNMNRR